MALCIFYDTDAVIWPPPNTSEVILKDIGKITNTKYVIVKDIYL